jgi:hypothetical protein
MANVTASSLLLAAADSYRIGCCLPAAALLLSAAHTLGAPSEVVGEAMHALTPARQERHAFEAWAALMDARRELLG